MRLLSFLTDIEKALRTAAAANNDTTEWECSRMVNFHQGMARVTIGERHGDAVATRGAMFLQRFALADGSLCLKTSLHWDGSDVTPVVAVYSKPGLDWQRESQNIAALWLAGPVNATTRIGEAERLAEGATDPLAFAERMVAAG